MPTLSNMNLPTPKSWEEFEEITLDALRIKWDNPDLQRHGRNGQSQNGIDIYGENYHFQFIGIQCKKYDLKLSKKTIETEIEKAENFEPKIEVFYIATTYPTDVTLQKEIRLISKERKRLNKFPVDIFFWNDIVQELITNEKIFNKHYPQISLDTFHENKYKRLFSLLDLSFFGTSLKHLTDVIFGETGAMAQEDPRQIEIAASIVKSACIATCSKAEQEEILSAIDTFLSYPQSVGKDNFHWTISDGNADLVAGKVKVIEHSLQNHEFIVFKIGELLAIWSKHEFDKKEDKPISNSIMLKLKDYLSKLNNGTIPKDIKNIIDNYENNYEDISFATIAEDVYNKLRQLLIEAELKNL